MPEEGLEPTLPCEKRILNPSRLPIPPLRHGKGIITIRGIYGKKKRGFGRVMCQFLKNQFLGLMLSTISARPLSGSPMSSIGRWTGPSVFAGAGWLACSGNGVLRILTSVE